MDAFDRLRQFDILAHFTDTQIEQLATCVSRVQHLPGDSVLKEGDQTREIYLIDTGEIHIQRNTPYGRYTLAKLKSGDVFGETSFVDQHARSGDATIETDTVLFSTNLENLKPVMDGDQRFNLALYWALWKSLSSKLRQTNNVLSKFFSKTDAIALTENTKEPTTKRISVGVDTKRSLFQEQKLSPLEINFLSTLSNEERIDPNNYIFHEGEPGDRMYIVLEGQVMISKQIAGAGEEALAFLERGDYFGEMALIDQEPRSADAKAHDSGAVLISISRDVIKGILDIQRVSSLSLLRLLCNLVAKRLREIDDKLVGWYIFAAGSGDSLDLPST